MIKKLYRKIKCSYAKYRRISVTTSNKKSKTSDIERWGQDKSLFSSWNDRTQLLANHIQPNSRVLEFGSAKLVLKAMLPYGCVYYNSDLVSRDKDTLVIDLSQELPEVPIVDYIVFSGVLEYLFDVEKVLVHLARFTDNFVFSYATTDAFPEIKTRRFHGWVSDLKKDNVEDLGKALGRKIEIIGFWKQQTLFHFYK